MKIALIIPDKEISDAVEEALAAAGIHIRQIGSFLHVVERIPPTLRPAIKSAAIRYLEGVSRRWES